MGQREDMIEREVRNVCNNYFENQLFDKGRDILRKLYLANYDKLDNINTRYNLLYRLIVAERRCKKPNETAIAMYTIQLKNDMDNIPNYKEKFTGNYLNMMSYYVDCEDIKLSKEELLEYHNFNIEYWKKNYRIYKSNENYLWLKQSEFDKELFLKNFGKVLNIVENIHNVSDPQVPSIIKQLVEAIKKTDEELYINTLKIIDKVTNIVCI